MNPCCKKWKEDYKESRFRGKYLGGIGHQVEIFNNKPLNFCPECRESLATVSAQTSNNTPKKE